jgi:asparagine synthase (glutamine-hydrolysing)
MCGFAVSVRRHGRIDRKQLQEALRRIGHRGPDASGLQIAEIKETSGRVIAEAGFVHARLSILDLDPRSNQPFRIDNNLLAYNGEIYNYRALATGMDLSTTGDTEVFLRLLMRRDGEALQNANGMWAFCWLDQANRRLVAGRDRYGKKPLFYAKQDDAIHFASEPAALAALIGRTMAMRPAALDSFMADGWLFPDPSGETHLEGIREVRPGYRLSLDLETWALEEHHAFSFPMSDGQLKDCLTSDALAPLLADAVEARLVSERKVGLFLSGGVDSSLILSVLAARGLTQDVVCITGDAGKSDDARYARACVEQLGIEALNVPLPYGSLGLEQFLAVCKVQAKPFPLIGNVLGMHALYKAVAEHDIRVVLDGSGADEIFGGYWHRYFAYALRDAEAAGDRAWIEAVQPSMPRSSRHQDGSNGWRPEREELQRHDLMELRPDMRAILAATLPHDPILDFQGTLGEALIRDATAGRMQEWLWQNDRNAMASSIENRSPFLDYRLLAWAATPYHAKFNGVWNKRELRDLFQRFVPLPTAERTDKQGFRWSYSQFFQQNLEPVLAMIAGSSMACRYIDPGRFADGVRRGRVSHDSRLLHRLTVIAGLEATGLGFSGGAAANRRM